MRREVLGRSWKCSTMATTRRAGPRSLVRLERLISGRARRNEPRAGSGMYKTEGAKPQTHEIWACACTLASSVTLERHVDALEAGVTSGKVWECRRSVRCLARMGFGGRDVRPGRCHGEVQLVGLKKSRMGSRHRNLSNSERLLDLNVERPTRNGSEWLADMGSDGWEKGRRAARQAAQRVRALAAWQPLRLVA